MKQIYCDAYGPVDIVDAVSDRTAKYRGTQYGSCGDSCLDCDQKCADVDVGFDLYALNSGDGDMVAVRVE